MKCPATGNDGNDDEKPVHAVALAGFYMDKTEVTNAQYNECVRAGKCTPPRYDDRNVFVWDNIKRFDGFAVQEFRSDNKPVVTVNWNQAVVYCQWMGGTFANRGRMGVCSTGRQ